ncbi:PREDICTED: uncharacterized protein LOC104593503 isoform X2 [Nelumbo nucifera]|nr:PREDICTED: uncharacterized protein LOC104593503 isoform X2 [Nelumbo nucifera]
MEVFPEPLKRLWNEWELRALVLLSLAIQIFLIFFGPEKMVRGIKAIEVGAARSPVSSHIGEYKPVVHLELRELAASKDGVRGITGRVSPEFSMQFIDPNAPSSIQYSLKSFRTLLPMMLVASVNDVSAKNLPGSAITVKSDSPEKKSLRAPLMV